MEFGTQLALDLREPAGSCSISQSNLASLCDLLAAVKKSGKEQGKTIAMIRRTLALVEAFLARCPEEITVNELSETGPAFKAYLKGRGYRRNSIRSYMGYRRILLRHAETLGWTYEQLALPEEWEAVLKLLGNGNPYRPIAAYAAQKGKHPSVLTDFDLVDWQQQAISLGSSYRSVMSLRSNFRSRILRSGLTKRFPMLSLRPTDRYGIPLHSLPEPLRCQVESLREWKLAEISIGRGSKSRHRAVSAKRLEYIICQIAGFILNVKHGNVLSLGDLVTEEKLADFTNWCVRHRRVRPGSIASSFSLLYAAVKRFPPLRENNFSWMSTFISDLPNSSYQHTRDAKARKWVRWEQLALAPGMIRQEADRLFKENPKKYALSVRDQLIISWFLIEPWRQRNVRECKLLPYEQGGNLFKGKISPLSAIAIPSWLKNALETDPDLLVWQYHFREAETKTGREVHSLLPKQLVPLLEQYVNKYRPLLINGHDPGTLFLNLRGKPLSRHSVGYIIGNLTSRFAGRRLNPHPLRDIAAVNWLEVHPNDPLSASKLLWHGGQNTLFKVYGDKFDESHAARRMEEYLDEHPVDLGVGDFSG